MAPKTIAAVMLRGVAAPIVALLLPLAAPSPTLAAVRGPNAVQLSQPLPQLSNERCPTSPYPECRRLHFRYGPLTITPGDNYNLVGPVTIEKPLADGYMTSITSNLVRSDGSTPPVDEVHLHHAVWLSEPGYGLTGNQHAYYTPFYGTGEEKTGYTTPTSGNGPGYGMRVRPTDVWLLDYMIHNLTPRAEVVYIVYDIDFVPIDAAVRGAMKPIKPLWIDVRGPDRPYYPVFNVQRGYGHINPATGRHECTFPLERCAARDPFGADQPGNGKGYDFVVPTSGTLVGLGGHLHPGGLRDEISLVRDIGGRQVERRIFTSRAVYYDRAGPVSWDFAMTVTPPSWAVKVRAGDIIRLNAVYDTELASWYEGMGIALAYFAPGDSSGVDPFQMVRVPVAARPPPPTRTRTRRRRTRSRPARLRASAQNARARRRGHGTARARPRRPRAATWRWEYVPLQTEGDVTHGHLPENDHHGGGAVRPLPTGAGPVTSSIGVTDFSYGPADLTTAATQGLIRAKANEPLTFTNFDALAGIWHSITTCANPCTGAAGVSYPVADALPPLDSTELGWAPQPPPLENSQASSQLPSFTIVPSQAGLQTGAVYTFFCRVHPFMRGAFKVVA
jgi:hypothetical protein